MSLTKRFLESRPGWGVVSEEERASMDEEAAYQAAFPEPFGEPTDDEIAAELAADHGDQPVHPDDLPF